MTAASSQPVWPDAEGEIRGLTLEPLHKAAPRAALKDSQLYELLARIDALREGRARWGQTAEHELADRLRRWLSA